MTAEGAATASPPAVDTADEKGVDYRATALLLWSLLDDIDTASDMARADDAFYRKMVERIHRRRFDVGRTDGYKVGFRRLS